MGNGRHRQRLLAGLLAAGIGGISAFAGQWQTVGGRWWYQNDNGGYPAAAWQEIDGKWYYFDENGYMLANTSTPDGYYVGADGAWAQGSSTGGVTADAAWAGAYREFILDKGYEFSDMADYFKGRGDWFFRDNSDLKIEFALYDMNGDGVPEIIAFNNLLYVATTCSFAIFTWNGNGVEYVDNIADYGIGYAPGSGYPGLFSSMAHTGVYVLTYHTLANGKLVSETVVERGDGFDGTGESKIFEKTNDEGLYLAGTSEHISPDFYTPEEIGQMGWDRFLAQAGYTAGNAGADSGSTSAAGNSQAAVSLQQLAGSFSNGTDDPPMYEYYQVIVSGDGTIHLFEGEGKSNFYGTYQQDPQNPYQILASFTTFYNSQMEMNVSERRNLKSPFTLSILYDKDLNQIAFPNAKKEYVTEISKLRRIG